MSIASTRKVGAEVPLSERTRGIGKGITESSRQEFITRGSKGMLELSTAKVGRVKLFKKVVDYKDLEYFWVAETSRPLETPG